MFGSDAWLWKEQDERAAAAPDPVVNPVGASRERPLTRLQPQRDHPDLHHAGDFRLRNRSSRSLRRRRSEASTRRAGGGVDRATSVSAAARLRETVAAAAGAEGRGAWDHRLDQPRNRQTEFRKVATAPARLMPALPLDSRISNRRLHLSVPDMESAWTISCATTLSDSCARSVGDRALCGCVALASCGVQADRPHAAPTGRGLSRGQRGQGRPACAACSFTTRAGAA